MVGKTRRFSLQLFEDSSCRLPLDVVVYLLKLVGGKNPPANGRSRGLIRGITDRSSIVLLRRDT
jgi:hypothetical protein